MKKVVFLLSAALMLGTAVNAQKKNVRIAKSKIMAETPDTKAAREAILPALKDSTTNQKAETWFMAGEVFHTTYIEEQKKLWAEKKADQALMGQSIKSALGYYLTADSLDQLPDKKGRVRPKYRDKIVERILGFQRGFTDAGSYYYDQKDFSKSLEMFQQYLQYPEIPILKDKGLEKDTLRPLITYYSALSATQGGKPEIAVPYYEQIKDSIDSEWIYARLADDYTKMKDTVNMLRLYKLGAVKFPKEQYYTRNLINYYINQDLMGEALEWINEALKNDSSAALWNLKGRILENDNNIEGALECYETAIQVDPQMADALGNIGRHYYNRAVEELDRVNAIKDDRVYRREKAKMKAVFEKPRPYFERAHAIDPEERDYIIALRGIYYNLQMNDKYDEMDKKMKAL